MLRLFAFVLLSVVNINLFSQYIKVSGSIKDIDTKEALPFVNITLDNTRNGFISSIDGNFSLIINDTAKHIRFSYLGYEPLTLILSLVSNYNNIQIYLKRKNLEIAEVTIVPGKNPAHRLIEKVIENRDNNNPEKMHSFAYTAYNKMYFTLVEDTFTKGKQLPLIMDSLEKDSSEIKLKKLLDKQYFFLCEFVSDRYFKYPDKNYEKVISSKVSGLSDPIFVLLATQLQSFSVYNEYLTVIDKRYINPISNNSVSRYSFYLEDTFYNEKSDTIFIISFTPRKGKNFEGLTGVLYINSNGYAIQNIIATPLITDKNFAIRINQKYDFIDNKKWFPTEINTDLLLRNSKIKTKSREHYFTAIGKSYLTNIKIDPDVSEINFSNIELEIEPDAARRDDDYWNNNRTVPLSRKDSATYNIIDSIGKKFHLDQKMLLLEAMLYGYIPIGGFNVDIRRMAGYNKFEGIKTGLGLSTNPKIFSFASIGGFFTYGFRDKNWKYHGFIQLFPKWYSDTKFTLRYANNVNETGGTTFFDEYLLNSTEFIYNYYINKMDKALEYEISFSFRTLQHFKFNLYLKQTNKTFDNYSFYSVDNNTTYNSLKFSETGIQCKFAYKEKFMKTPGGRKLSTGTKYPILWFNYRKGLDILKGDLTYTKLEAKFSKSLYTKVLGKTQLQIKTGKVFGDIPLSDLYNAQGCYDIVSVDAENYFATIRPAEFFSSEYCFFFLRQNFGSLLFTRGKFKPEIQLVTNFGWGQMLNSYAHQGISYKTMEKGFVESGLLINRILNMPFISTGIGLYYRYGNYMYSKIADNFAFKITFTTRF